MVEMFDILKRHYTALIFVEFDPEKSLTISLSSSHITKTPAALQAKFFFTLKNEPRTMQIITIWIKTETYQKLITI